jgi:hypothetical protein
LLLHERDYSKEKSKENRPDCEHAVYLRPASLGLEVHDIERPIYRRRDAS